MSCVFVVPVFFDLSVDFNYVNFLYICSKTHHYVGGGTFGFSFEWCLRFFIPVMRHFDQGTKGRHLIGTALQFQRLSPLLSQQEA